jgi:hypothetical protein
MVVKAHKFKLPQFFVFNVVASAIFLGTAAYAVRHALVWETAPSCSERYTNVTLFPMARVSGEALTTADLQARLAGRDWGLLENGSIVRLEYGPVPAALQIDLKSQSARGDGGERRGGLGFEWTPSFVRHASAACLTYSIRLPEDFDFGPGGSLPGLFGAVEEVAKIEPKPGFSARYRWREDGKLDVRATTAGQPDGVNLAVDPNWLQIARGTWVAFEQEIVLNTPGLQDGVLRVWVDGDMRFERKNLAFRHETDGFAGVVAAIHYSRADLAPAPAAKAGSVLLSPLELRWR